MVERENLSNAEKSHEDYTPLVDIPARGYWFGSIYKGTYYSRLEIATKPLEAILRAGNFPPIVLASDRYGPEKPDEITILGADPSGIAYMGRSQKNTFKRGLRELNSSFFSLKSMEEVAKVRQEDCSVGWYIKINSEKLYDSLLKKLHNSSKDVFEKEFTKKFNRVLRESLLTVSVMESVGARLPGAQRIAENVLQIIWNLDNVRNFASSASPVDKIVGMTTDNSVDITSSYIIQRLVYGRDSIKNSRGTIDGSLYASAKWRELHFPDEFQKERSKQGIYARNRLLTSPLPLSTLLHSTYSTFVALQLHREPLVRIGKNQVNLGL